MAYLWIPDEKDYFHIWRVVANMLNKQLTKGISAAWG